MARALAAPLAQSVRDRALFSEQLGKNSGAGKKADGDGRAGEMPSSVMKRSFSSLNCARFCVFAPRPLLSCAHVQIEGLIGTAELLDDEDADAEQEKPHTSRIDDLMCLPAGGSVPEAAQRGARDQL